MVICFSSSDVWAFSRFGSMHSTLLSLSMKLQNGSVDLKTSGGLGTVKITHVDVVVQSEVSPRDELSPANGPNKWLGDACSLTGSAKSWFSECFSFSAPVTNILAPCVATCHE